MTAEHATAAPVLPFANPDQFSLRVFTFGPFRIEWIDPSTGQATPLPAERLHGRGAAPSLALLKALLGRPDRFATRDWIMDQFWPESKRRSAEERLDDVASSLRALLRPEGSSAKLVQYVYGSDGRGAGYRLAGYPQVWCDTDAFVWYVEHASLLDRMGQDSSACWQRAYELAARGMYLPEHLYEDWARARRETLEGLLRDCVLRWSQLLRQAGHVDEAIRRLRTYWEERPTDEDALRLLLELLGERERFGEAEACYATAEAALAEDGHQPDPRTREMIEVVRALQIRRSIQTEKTRSVEAIPIVKENVAVPLFSSNSQWRRVSEPDTARTSVSQSWHVPYSRNSFLMEREEVLFALHEQQIVKLTTEQLAVLRSILEDNNMAHFDPSKRETLRKIAIAIGAVTSGARTLGDPELWEKLSAAQAKASAFNEVALDTFENLIEEGWKLSNINMFDAAEGILASLLPKIQAIPPSEVSAGIAFIASQALRLQSILMHHRSCIAEKMLMCQESVEYARYANDANTLTTALVELATAYEYSGQLENCFQTLQEALFHCSHASPLVQSRVYSHNAILLASNKRKKEAELYIKLAHETFPDDPTADPAYALADSNVFMLSHHTGVVHLNNGQLTQAFQGFEFYKNHPSGTNIPERLRLEIINGLSRAAIRAGELERYIALFEDSIVEATRLGSKKRFNEAISIFQQEIPQTWRTNGHIKALAEKYQLSM
jgi:DNA-binding SARP family transcriptional activator